MEISQIANPRDAGGRSAMTLRIATEPEVVAVELRDLVTAGANAGVLAARYGVSHQTVLRWRWRLEVLLGDRWKTLGFAFQMGRPPSGKPLKAKPSGKKRGRPKKVVAN